MNQALLQTVQQLPLEDKLELLNFLYKEIEPRKTSLPESERLIIKARLERMQQNQKPAKPWREFLQEID